MDTIELMRVFVATAHAGSFTAAGRQLGRSKALVSKYVGALEQRLGVRLFNRTTRHLGLTQAGAAYLAQAQPLLDEFGALEAMVREEHETPRGRLRVSAPRALGERALRPVTAGFLAAYPEIQLEMDLSDRHVDLVEEGFDAVVRVAELQESGLIARKIGSAQHRVCAAL